MRLPHPIPYQGSKRKLAHLIGRYVPKSATFYEPFCGSGAMTIYAAHKGLANRFVLGDSLEPIVRLQQAIVEMPAKTADRYQTVWEGQTSDNFGYFNDVRARYNADRDAVDLLYLICRCVKNAIRFNKAGNFTQSHDKRRLGTHPEKMRAAIHGVSQILKGKVEYRVGDWLETTFDADPDDFVYMDPPYLGTSVGPDKRYHQQMTQEPLIAGLAKLNARSVPFVLSYDGMTGDKEYGPPLPDHLGMTRLLLHAGMSSQATLSGRKEETVESLYLSADLAEPVDGVIRAPAQLSLTL
ncbi:DNA adenine methylase [Maricaulis sp.]|uniref:DNA adenine methylase n=1 Tax=Maricaulis sp. TaxID=1486257 RepID=UPI003A90E76C